jgi:transposase
MTDDLEGLRARLVVGHKRDGRSVYDEAAKSELVALCMQPGASVSRLARECGVNANQVSRWLREHGHGRRQRVAVAAASTPPPFVAVSLVRPPEVPVDHNDTVPHVVVLSLKARLPNGVAVELDEVEVRHIGDVIEALGRLRCSASTRS